MSSLLATRPVTDSLPVGAKSRVTSGVASRRTLITGLVALVAAPAIVKATNLMKVAPTEKLRYWAADWGGEDQTAAWGYNPLLNEWTRYSNSAPMTLDQYGERIMRPMLDSLAASIEREAVLARDFYAGEQWSAEKVGEIVHFRHCVPQIPTALGVAALAVAAAPVVEQVLQKPVTRRFWK